MNKTEVNITTISKTGLIPDNRSQQPLNIFFP